MEAVLTAPVANLLLVMAASANAAVTTELLASLEDSMVAGAILAFVTAASASFAVVTFASAILIVVTALVAMLDAVKPPD